MSKNKNTPLVIIPAAGYGTRSGSPPAKEMLPRGEKGGPLILEPILNAYKRKWSILVITRQEKQEIINFLEELTREYPDMSLNVLIIPPTNEWPDTVLESKNFWHKWNLVYLPDVAFEPVGILDDMWNETIKDEYNLLVAVHKVSNLSNWGIILPVENRVEICEKPSMKKSGLAWGLYFFKKEIGEKLLKAQSQSAKDQRSKKLEIWSQFFTLDKFQDLTRMN